MRRRGFTLIELITSLAVMGILAVAMGSSIMLASRALPQSGGDAEAMSAASRGWAVISDDLRTATQVQITDTSSMTVVVPDRGESGADLTVKLSWNSDRGGQLVRQIETGPTGVLVGRADSVEFEWASPAAVATGESHRIRATITVSGSVFIGEQRLLNAERLD